MKLVKARICNFRSAEDTGTFDVADLTCLVGMNESGKTSVLSALHGVNPADKRYSYDKIRDYPRRNLARYKQRHGADEAEVAITTWALSPDDVAAVAIVLGEGALQNETLEITSRYGGQQTWDVRVDENRVRAFLLSSSGVEGDELERFQAVSIAQMRAEIANYPDPSAGLLSVSKQIDGFRKGRPALAAIDILTPRRPAFFYTSHFDRISGEISLEKLAHERNSGEDLCSGDKILLDFLDYAGMSIDELDKSTRLEEFSAKCQAASNDLSDEIFEFWSQSDALRLEIAVAQGRPEDSAPFNSGTVFKLRIYNANHKVSVPLSERSAGFVWFFSFLAQFKRLHRLAPGAIILLDEPGLTLHGNAQADLLRYISERLLPEHQVIYCTHSPFMIPADRLEDVRWVEDVVCHDQRHRPEVKGTRVSSDALGVKGETLLPLRTQLVGRQFVQKLSAGVNTLLVDRPSDVLYLQAASHALKERRREGLDSRWTLCPAGGLADLRVFSSLLCGCDGDARIAALGACRTANDQVGRQCQDVIKRGEFLAVSDLTGKDAAGIEDFFAPFLFAEIVNGAYELRDLRHISPTALAVPTTREGIVSRVEAILRAVEPGSITFDHFAPAAWLICHPHVLAKDHPAVDQTLDRFERAFMHINGLLK